MTAITAVRTHERINLRSRSTGVGPQEAGLSSAPRALAPRPTASLGDGGGLRRLSHAVAPHWYSDILPGIADSRNVQAPNSSMIPERLHAHADPRYLCSARAIRARRKKPRANGAAAYPPKMSFTAKEKPSSTCDSILIVAS